MYQLNHFVINFDKVQSLEDIKTILKDLKLGFENPSEDLQKLCKLVNKQSGEEVRAES